MYPIRTRFSGGKTQTGQQFEDASRLHMTETFTVGTIRTPAGDPIALFDVPHPRRPRNRRSGVSVLMSGAKRTGRRGPGCRHDSRGLAHVSAGFAGRCGILPAASPQNERPEDEPGRHEDGERRYGRHDVAAAPA